MYLNKFPQSIQLNNTSILVLTIQISTLGAIALNFIKLDIPLIRPILAFTYLTFVPGFLILKILDIKKMSLVELFLYSCGLSISILMFTGLIINTVYPYFGITNPLSTFSLIVTLNLETFILSIILIRKNHPLNSEINNILMIKKDAILTKFKLLLIPLPILSILGAYLYNYYYTNSLTLIMLIYLMIIILLIGFEVLPFKKEYPFAIFIITISILLHNTLISTHIWGWDIHLEYYVSNIVINNSAWDSSKFSNLNSMLSIVILIPLYSKICGISSIWVLKIIFPLIFSLVPVGLYEVFRKQTNCNIAFLSCFFFISPFVFHIEMPSLARQEVAELFLALLLLIMTSEIESVGKKILFIIFGMSLAVSHYSLTYIYLFIIITSAFALYFKNIFETTYKKKYNIHSSEERNIPSHKNEKLITPYYICLLVSFSFMWYVYTTDSSAFSSMLKTVHTIVNGIYSDFLNPETIEGMSILMERGSPTLLSQINRIINYFNQIFIIIGVFSTTLNYTSTGIYFRKLLSNEILNSKKGKILFSKDIPHDFHFNEEFLLQSIVGLIILFMSILVPFFASSLNMTRIYHITLFFLAPMCVIGFVEFFLIVKKMQELLTNGR
jgi:uncharacterized membrane protein